MSDLFSVFWTLIIFASIAWYAFLLFYVGAKAGREIKVLTRALEKRASSPEEEQH